MIKELVKDTDFLAKPLAPATADDAQIAQDLRDTMASLDNCACLAANQIGYDKAVIAYEAGAKGVAVMFNPQVKQAMIPYMATESCLSLSYDSDVKRFKRIIVAYEELVDGKLVARQKKFADWTAETILHAIDHCNGLLV